MEAEYGSNHRQEKVKFIQYCYVELRRTFHSVSHVVVVCFINVVVVVVVLSILVH
jgi:preprotein translocase subunit SecE